MISPTAINALSSPRAAPELSSLASRPPIQPAASRALAPGFTGASSFTPASGASASQVEATAVPPDKAKAYGTQVAKLSISWAQQLQRFADITGVKMGGSLSFGIRGGEQLANLIQSGASPDRIMNRADRLLAEWDQRIKGLFNHLGDGMYRNAARSAQETAGTLRQAGVTGAPVQAARNMANVFRQLAQEAAPPGGGPIDIGRAQQMMSQALAQYAQAANQDRAQHPEHGPALMNAGRELQAEMTNVLRGFSLLNATGQAMAQQRAQLIRPKG